MDGAAWQTAPPSASRRASAETGYVPPPGRPIARIEAGGRAATAASTASRSNPALSPRRGFRSDACRGCTDESGQRSAPGPGRCQLLSYPQRTPFVPCSIEMKRATSRAHSEGYSLTATRRSAGSHPLVSLNRRLRSACPIELDRVVGPALSSNSCELRMTEVFSQRLGPRAEERPLLKLPAVVSQHGVSGAA